MVTGDTDMIRIDFDNFNDALYAGARVNFLDGGCLRTAIVNHNPAYPGEFEIDGVDAYLFLVLMADVYVM